MVMERMHGVPISDMARLRAAGTDIAKLARERRRDLLHAGVPRQLLPRRHASRQHLRADRRPGESALRRAGLRHRRHARPARQELPGGELPRVLRPRLPARRRAARRIRLGAAGYARRRDGIGRSARCASRSSTGRCKEISFGHVLLRLFEISRRFNMEVQPQLMLLQKTLLNIEGLGRDLYPELDIWKTASPILRDWMRERASLRQMLQEPAPAAAAADRGGPRATGPRAQGGHPSRPGRPAPRCSWNRLPSRSSGRSCARRAGAVMGHRWSGHAARRHRLAGRQPRQGLGGVARDDGRSGVAAA